MGILIDSGLTWANHIDHLSKKLSRATGLLYKIRPFVTYDILKMLYYSLAYSHLNYGIEVWGSADDIHLNKILLNQKRIVRMLTFSDKRLENYSLPASDPFFFRLGFL